MTSLKTYLLLLASVMTLSCSHPMDEQEGTALTATPEDSASSLVDAKRKDPVLVRVSNLHLGNVEKKLESTATVQSLDVIDLMPERAEPVVEILVEEGDQVEAGQTLARLRNDSAKLAVAEAEVRVFETQQAMDQAQREFERDKSLKETGGPTGVLSDRDLETRRQTWDATKTAHQTAKVAYDRTLLELKQCTLVSPISGTISARDISLGDMASVGSRVFEITDLSHPKVILYRPQRELMDLRVGQKLIATSEALPGLKIPGQLERIAPTVDLNTGTIKVTAALQPQEQHIPTGILVKLTLILETHEQALLIPKQALLHEGDHVYCFAVKEGIAHRIQVFPGFENENAIEAGEGTALAVEDQVVIVGADRINDGDSVEIADE